MTVVDHSVEAPSRAAAAPQKPAAPSARCRIIETADDASVAQLLACGFPARSAREWNDAMVRLREMTRLHGLPAVGYLLDAGDRPVGVLLTLYSPDRSRCNVSSWYVEPGFRRYASMLVTMAIRDRGVTYLNISSVQHTRPVIEAQGFRRYANGVVIALPILGGKGKGVSLHRDVPPSGVTVDPVEVELAEAHKAMGCTVLWCAKGNRAAPYIFVRRKVANRLPAAQVVYSPHDVDWRAVARPIGMALLGRGLLFMVVDAASAVPGLTGRFLAGRMPKYARGPAVPRFGDLAWTEAAMFGT